MESQENEHEDLLNCSILTKNTSLSYTTLRPKEKKSIQEKNSMTLNSFINNNQHIFNKFGLEEFLKDPIFHLREDDEAKPNDTYFNEEKSISTKESNKISFGNVNSIGCLECNKAITTTTLNSIFKKHNYCKFCGCSVCSNCISSLKQRNKKLICSICSKKFAIYDIQQDFKTKFQTVEFEIKEASQLSESTSLKYSESCNEIETLKEELSEIKNEQVKEKQKIKGTLDMYKRKKEECDNECLKISSTINGLIEEFQRIDASFSKIDNEKKEILSERETYYKEYILKQDKLNKLNKENQDLSLSLESYNDQINKRIVIDTSKDLKIIFIEPVNVENKTNKKKSNIFY